MKNLILILVGLFIIPIYSQNKKTVAFSTGADIGWLLQMEASGYKFYDWDGKEKDCLQLLKDRGMNSIRLRVWVNPNDDKRSGHCSKAETITMALRAKSMGMRVMIDFHYSDSWADPSKQFKPKARENHTFPQLLNDVFSHTFDVISSLKKAGVTPEWVQIGNEIPGGMLWPEGSTDNWIQLGQLLNKGYNAVKKVDKKIKVIIHIDEGNNNKKFRTFFDNATTQKVKYDVIGMSYYPYWIKKDYTETIAALQFNLNDIASRYKKEVMVVEVGGEYDKVLNTKKMVLETIKAVKNVANNKGLGVFYWEPEGEKSWSGYSLSAWKADGKPSEALDAFKSN